MLHLLPAVLAALAAAPDTSGIGSRSKPDLPSERLGNVYSYLETIEDRGFNVEVWRNETLGRQELWYKPCAEECFLRVNETTYVRAKHEGGEWKTDPSVRLVYQGDEWKRRTIRASGR